MTIKKSDDQEPEHPALFATIHHRSDERPDGYPATPECSEELDRRDAMTPDEKNSLAAMQMNACKLAGRVFFDADGNVEAFYLTPRGFEIEQITSKWKREDPRNELIDEMGRLIEELLPKAVMMENVPGLAKKGRARLDAFITKLEALDYIVTYDVLQVADFGTPQLRKRLVLMAGRGFEIELPKPTHSKTGSADLKRWASVRSAIGGLPEPSCFQDVRATKANDLTGWHVVRKMSPANVERLKWIKLGGDWRTIPERLRPPCHQGEYFGFRNVYGRMAWDAPSPTITAGCATLSKGRFGHPDKDRTISIKEAALIQQFPSDYKIDTNKIDQACSIIGNALPCGFANIMASVVSDSLTQYPTQKYVSS